MAAGAQKKNPQIATLRDCWGEREGAKKRREKILTFTFSFLFFCEQSKVPNQPDVFFIVYLLGVYVVTFSTRLFTTLLCCAVTYEMGSVTLTNGKFFFF